MSFKNPHSSSVPAPRRFASGLDRSDLGFFAERRVQAQTSKAVERGRKEVEERKVQLAVALAKGKAESDAEIIAAEVQAENTQRKTQVQLNNMETAMAAQEQFGDLRMAAACRAVQKYDEHEELIQGVATDTVRQEFLMEAANGVMSSKAELARKYAEQFDQSQSDAVKRQYLRSED